MDTESLKNILSDYTTTIIDFLPRLAPCIVIFLIGSAIIKKVLAFSNNLKKPEALAMVLRISYQKSAGPEDRFCL